MKETQVEAVLRTQKIPVLYGEISQVPMHVCSLFPPPSLFIMLCNSEPPGYLASADRRNAK